jgi:hypothetical protein
MEKTKQKYVLPMLTYCHYTTTFDLWMSREANDVLF